MRIAGLFLVLAIIAFSLSLSDLAIAAQSTDRTVNFQGRLRSSGGNIVPNGSYNMQFKIYHGGSGDTAGNPSGTLAWTETYTNGGTSGGVEVRNGYFNVSLGSINSFGSSVNWNHSSLWISMNVAGNSPSCVSFGTEPCGADGEMLPMSKISASPFAINSGAVGGKTAENLVQLAQGVQEDASTNTSSIFINKTGSGNLVQLQNDGKDVFNISQDGDLTLGSAASKTISIATSGNDTNGGSLAILAGNGGSGDGSDGGTLTLQGGDGGGTNSKGGDVIIDTGTPTGTGIGGTVSIGSTNASDIEIGSTSVAVNQDIIIGGNNTAGSTTNVVIGAGSEAEGGSTTVRGKDSVAISTDGIDRAVFSGSTNTLYFGNGVSSSVPSDFTIQGTDSSAPTVAGGSLSIQGGNATAGDGNGGNVTISGGSGSGNGVDGLVVLSTPAVTTVSNDANCFSGGSLATSSCTLSSSSVNSAAAAIVGFSVVGQTVTVPDPTIQIPGRIFYLSAANDSQEFSLIINKDDEEGAEQQITMRRNTTTTLFWNGTDWTPVGSSGATTLQDAYNNTPKSNGGTEIVLNGSGGDGGLTIRSSTSDPVGNTLLDVQDADSSQIFSVNNQIVSKKQFASDGGVNDDLNFYNNWTSVGGSTIQRIATDGQESSDSASVQAGTSANSGIANILGDTPKEDETYLVSVYVKLTSGSPLEDFRIQYSPDNGSTFSDCAEYSTRIISSEWTKVDCTLETDSTAATTPLMYFTQPTEADESRVFLIDSFTLKPAPVNASNVKVGSASGDSFTIFTLDKATSAPNIIDDEAMLGSMYYDTTLGRIQCYEVTGWGNCSASPDIFVTLSPEYPNAVMNGAIDGNMSSDLCSYALNINDGSSSQPAICDTNETYNFYEWISSEASEQTHSIYVTYTLPDTFKSFAPGSTSLVGRSSDSSDAGVNYQIYRDTGSSGIGLVACGESVPIPTGAQPAWGTGWASGSADPANCGFQAGDKILFRINLSSANGASAYVSNLDFVFSNN